VGERLANFALYFNYGRIDVVPYGPMPVRAVRKNDQVIVSFQYADHLQTKEHQPLKGFKILNELGNPIASKAFIKGNEVVIQIDTKASAKTVLYGWDPYTDANLEDGASLPASTFKLDIN
jgi:sialate O-acetylesterase